MAESALETDIERFRTPVARDLGTVPSGVPHRDLVGAALTEEERAAAVASSQRGIRHTLMIDSQLRIGAFDEAGRVPHANCGPELGLSAVKLPTTNP